jgi:hypothetical protein
LAAGEKLIDELDF